MTELHPDRTSIHQTLLLKGGSWFLSAGLISASAQVPVPDVHAAATIASVTASTAHTATHAATNAWRQLTPVQKQALAPLGAQWGALTAQQQSKWLIISKNFSELPVANQITIHARMADWVN